jgi:hypothetical protein
MNNIVPMTAHSLQWLSRALPFSDRKEQLIRSAENMLIAIDANREPCSQLWLEECLSDIPEACKYYNEQADNLLSEC